MQDELLHKDIPQEIHFQESLFLLIFHTEALGNGQKKKKVTFKAIYKDCKFNFI